MSQGILKEDSDMTATKGLVVPPGGGKRLELADARPLL